MDGLHLPDLGLEFVGPVLLCRLELKIGAQEVLLHSFWLE